MRVTIRGAVCAAALAAAGTAQAQDGAAPEYGAQELAAGLTLISGPDGNSVLARTADGVVLIDGGRAENADALLAFVAEQTGGARVTTLVTTDWHEDRTGANEALGAAGARIVAHFNALPWLQFGADNLSEGVSYPPRAAAALPDTLVMDGGMTLPFGEDRMDLGFLMQAHCDSDLYVYFPGANVLVTGPGVRSDAWVVLDYWAGGYIGGTEDGIEELLAIADDETVIVPASGPVMTKADLQAQHELYAEMFRRVSALVLSARSPEEAQDARPTEGFHPEWADADIFVAAAHRSFRTHLRRDPRIGPVP